MISRTTVDSVVSVTVMCYENIVTFTAIEGIIRTAAVDGIVPHLPVNHVLQIITGNGICTAIGTENILDMADHIGISTGNGIALRTVHTKCNRETGGITEIRRIDSCTTVDNIITPFGNDEIIPVVPPKGIDTVCTDQRIGSL